MNEKGLEAARKALSERGRSSRRRQSFLDNSRVQKRIVVLEKEASSIVNAYKVAMDGRSRALAVKVFCIMCVGYVRQEVRLCSSPECPLYPYRPFQTEAEEESGELVEEPEEVEEVDGDEGPAGPVP
jgi:hypothetical protein